MSDHLTAIDNDLLFTKNDPQDPRIGEFINKSPTCTHAVLGYPDDEGIQNNGGRIGASEAPNRIRKYLYRMTLPVLKGLDMGLHLKDLGNIKTQGSISDRQKIATDLVKNELDTKKVLTLGGGHDYGFPDGSAFLETYKDLKPLVINFDAHLDVRPYKANQPINSGTPFYRLLDTYKNFDCLELGIQSQCNSSYHYEWALQKNAHVLSYEELSLSGESFTRKMLEFLEPHIFKKRPTFLSIDMDVFSNAFAPGCSQAFATGLTPFDFMPVLKVLLKRLDVKIMGIYEVSPPLDVDDRTSKLAAQIAYEYLIT